MKTKTLLCLSFSLGLLGLLPANAATRTWTGGAVLNDFWTDKDNWAGGVAPLGGDTLVFPTGIQASDKGTRNTFNAATVFDKLIFHDGDYSVEGGPVLLSSGIVAATVDDQTAHFVRFLTGLRLAANQTFAATNTGLWINPGVAGDAIGWPRW